MLMLSSLISLLFMGLAVDATTSTRADAAEDEEIPDSGEGDEGGEEENPGIAVDGTSGSDWLAGGDGDDLLEGGDGNDDLHGGLGDDTMRGGAGTDWIYGDDDYGIEGDDEIDGGDGDDSLAGQGGDDTVLGGAGNDTMFGGEGDDLLNGGTGNDWISGNAGNDTLVAGPGEDDLDGGAGDDLLQGSAGETAAWLHGGEGDDTLQAGAGDFAEGGAGADLFVLDEPGTTVPTIGDFDGASDRLELRYEAAPDEPEPMVTLDHAEDGATVIRLDGEAVGRLLNAQGLRVEDIALSRLDPAR